MPRVITGFVFALSADSRRFYRQMRQAAKGATEVEKAHIRLLTSIHRASQGARRFAKRIVSLQGAFGLLAGGGAIAAVAGGLQQVIRNMADFEDGANRVRAVTGATAREFERLTAQARNLGSTTRFTASEVASGQAFLGQAGFNAVEILQAVPALLDLAAAGMLELGDAADITSNIMGAFNREARETGDVADVLAATATRSNTNIQQLGEALSYVGPIANTLGLSIRDTAAAIGILGNNGLQASRAGTGLNTILSRLLNPSDKAIEVFERLGITLRDSEGQLRSFIDILGEMNERGAETADFFNVFEQRGAPAAAIFASNADAARELRDQLDGVAGEAQRVAQQMEEGLGGTLRSVRSAWEGLTIAIGQSEFGQNIARLIDLLAENIRALTPEVTVAADTVETLGQRYKETGDEIARIEAELAKLDGQRGRAARVEAGLLNHRLRALKEEQFNYNLLASLRRQIRDLEREEDEASIKRRRAIRNHINDLKTQVEEIEAAAEASRLLDAQTPEAPLGDTASQARTVTMQVLSTASAFEELQGRIADTRGVIDDFVSDTINKYGNSARAAREFLAIAESVPARLSASTGGREGIEGVVTAELDRIRQFNSGVIDIVGSVSLFRQELASIVDPASRLLAFNERYEAVQSDIVALQDQLTEAKRIGTESDQLQLQTSAQSEARGARSAGHLETACRSGAGSGRNREQPMGRVPQDRARRCGDSGRQPCATDRPRARRWRCDQEACGASGSDRSEGCIVQCHRDPDSARGRACASGKAVFDDSGGSLHTSGRWRQ